MPLPHMLAQTSMQQPHTPVTSARPPPGEQMHAMTLLLTSMVLAASLRLWNLLLIHILCAIQGQGLQPQGSSSPALSGRPWLPTCS